MSEATQRETPSQNQPSDKLGFIAAMRAHPASVGESYFEHMRFALRFSGLLFCAAGAALVHAVLPALFETTASRLIGRMSLMAEARH